MTVTDSRKNLPVAREGLPYILRFLAVGILFSLIPSFFCRVISAICFVLSAFCGFFFRDPERKTVHDSFTILAPGDGRVLEISEEINPILGGQVKVIKIFLSIFNVHIQRAPISGVVKNIEYSKGKFLDARDPHASSENENNVIVIENEKCKLIVKQITGFIARKIDCWVHLDENVVAGQRIGLIRFGSQVDLILPNDTEVCVSKGEKVAAGVSIVAIRKEKVQR